VVAVALDRVARVVVGLAAGTGRMTYPPNQRVAMVSGVVVTPVPPAQAAVTMVDSTAESIDPPAHTVANSPAVVPVPPVAVRAPA
jgi:hypothetical protein